MSKLPLAAIGPFLLLTICCAASGRACASPGPAQSNQEAASTTPSSKLVVAAVDLTGADREMGKFLTDTLITDLSRSTVLQPLERSTVQASMIKSGLTPERALTAAEVRGIGASVSADRILVGTFLQRDEQLIVNVRMLDAHTGLVMPGGAMSVSGNRNDLLSISHRLSKQLHKRLTNLDLTFEEQAAAGPPDHPQGGLQVISAPRPLPADDLQILKGLGLIPATAKSNAKLTGQDLATLVKSAAKSVAPQSNAATTINPNPSPVTRIRVLTALVKLIVSPDDLANYHSTPPAKMPVDTAQAPSWGQPYLAAAVDQGWWSAERPIAARELATWAFVATVLTRLPLHQSSGIGVVQTTAEPAGAPLVDQDDQPYTGLVIDAFDLDLQRAMGPRILDEAGRVIYPDPGHVPDEDFVQDRGMVSYYAAVTDAKRAGIHPLIIRALKVSAIGHDDITVSNEAAELIREANRRGKFLWKWSVAVLAGKSAQPAQTASQNPTAP